MTSDEFDDLVWSEMDKGHENTVAVAIVRERLRCRAIVLRNHGNDWSANKTLRQIDGEP